MSLTPTEALVVVDVVEVEVTAAAAGIADRNMTTSWDKYEKCVRLWVRSFEYIKIIFHTMHISDNL